MPVSRDEVFEVVAEERAYQEQRWGDAPSAGVHTVTEYLTYLQYYLDQAVKQVSTQADPQASEAALHTIRKITALGVACQEQNGVRRRVP